MLKAISWEIKDFQVCLQGIFRGFLGGPQRLQEEFSGVYLNA